MIVKSPTAVDQRRLRDAAAALDISAKVPQTRAEAEAQLWQLHDAIAAMQSLDDLGEEGNRQAMKDHDELLRRYEAVEKLLKEMPR